MPARLLIALLLACPILLGAAQPGRAQPVRELPAFEVPIDQTSVSGLSSGGYMAVQFQVAFSAILRGAGVIAGGPYNCARSSLSRATSVCSCVPFGCPMSSQTGVPELIRDTDRNAGRGLIDPTANLARHRVWLFSGTADSAVPQRIMDDLLTYYRNYIPAEAIAYEDDVPAEHAMPTDFFGNPCPTRGDPFINDCDFDAAGALLGWILGELNPKNTGAARGQVVAFNQRRFIAEGHGMGARGFLYVPRDCEGGPCRLHVVFHGCQQYPEHRFSSGGRQVVFGTTFVENTGYNRWADTNRLLVLYPQAATTSANPNGCWDWWGYDDPNYATRNGRQMAAVKAMVDRIASGRQALPAPARLRTTEIGETFIALAWDAVAGATGYNVYLDGTAANAAPVPGTAFTVRELLPGTEHELVVRALGPGGEGAASAPLRVRTRGQPAEPPAAACVRASNFDHVRGGRAFDRLGLAFAAGSEQFIGLDNVFFVSELRETAPGTWILDDCP